MKKNEKVTIFFLQPFLVYYLNYELMKKRHRIIIKRNGRFSNLACDVNIPPVIGHRPSHFSSPVVDNVDVYAYVKIKHMSFNYTLLLLLYFARCRPCHLSALHCFLDLGC